MVCLSWYSVIPAPQTLSSTSAAYRLSERLRYWTGPLSHAEKLHHQIREPHERYQDRAP
jgi:hypothetical protein